MYAIRRTLRAILVAAAAASLSACGADPFSAADVRALDAAQLRWALQGFRDYVFVTRRTCACPPDRQLRVEVEVRAGVVANVTDLEGDSLLPATDHTAWYTVEDLFAIVRHAERVRTAEKVTVAFDSVLGYPTRVVIDLATTGEQGRTSFEIMLVRPLDAALPALVPLLPEFPYAAWYREQTGLAPDSGDFGVYSMHPVAGTLYLGFGTELPAQGDGALLAAFDGDGIRAIGQLDEQGFMDMTSAGDTVLIPGVDPCCPDGWEAGNFYTYTPGGELIKRRTLPNVIHTWSARYDAAGGMIYVSTGSHRGDFVTGTGEIWRSADQGASWERLWDGDDGVGFWRAYDIIRQHDRWYALADRSDGTCVVVAEPTGDTTWTEVLSGAACRQRLAKLRDALVVLSGDRRSLHVIRRDGPPLRVALPFSVAYHRFNWSTVAGGFLFALADDAMIRRSRDAIVWEPVATSAEDLVSIAFWPYRSRLVVASRGIDGAIWTLRLCAGSPC